MSSNRINVCHVLFVLVPLLTCMFGSELKAILRAMDNDTGSPHLYIRDDIVSDSIPGCHIVTLHTSPIMWGVAINYHSRPNWTDSTRDLWTSGCTLYYKEQQSPWESTSLDYQYFDRVQVASFSHNDITHIDDGYFCSFKNLTIVFLENNMLNDVNRIGLGQYNGTDCGSKLQWLSLGGNPLVNIPNDSFSALQQLVEINLANCQLTSIETGTFDQLKKLTRLTLSGNYLTHFDYGKSDIRSSSLFYRSHVDNSDDTMDLKTSTSPLPRLIYLDLSKNKLANATLISVNHLTSLQTLYLNGNRLESIPNITGLAQLTVLIVSDNLIQKLEPSDFTGVDKLIQLDLSFNQISAIATLDGIRRNYLTGNKTAHLGQVFIPSSVTRLHLDHNQLTKLELWDINPNVESLHLAHNMIEHVQMFNGTDYISSLIDLDLSFNRLTNVDNLSSLTKLKYLDLEYNMLANMSTDSFINLTSLNKLDLDGNGLSFIPKLSGLVELRSLQLSNNSLISLTKSDFSGLKISWLDLSSNQIDTIEDGTFDDMRELRHLNLSNNRIINLSRNLFSIPFHSTRFRSSLDLSHNYLTQFSFSQVPSGLEILYLSHNNIEILDSENITFNLSLVEVDLSFNNLTIFEDLSLPPNIYLYDITNNPIKRFSFDPTYRRNITLSAAVHRRFWSIHDGLWIPVLNRCQSGPQQCRCVDKYTSPGKEVYYYTNCSMSNITRVPEEFHHANLTSIDIRAIWLDGNHLTTIKSNDFNTTFNLEKLFLNDSNVQHIEENAFRNLYSLRILHLDHNYIWVITPNMVKGLRGLRELYLDHNEISRIDEGTFATLQSLEILHLHNNRLVHIDVGIFTQIGSLKTLYIHRNPWKCDCDFMKDLIDIISGNVMSTAVNTSAKSLQQQRKCDLSPNQILKFVRSLFVWDSFKFMLFC